MNFWYIVTFNLTIVTIVDNNKYRYLYLEILTDNENTKIDSVTEQLEWKILTTQTKNAWKRLGGEEYNSFGDLIAAHPDIFCKLL